MSLCKKCGAISTLMMVLIILIVVVATGATAVFFLLRSGWSPWAWSQLIGSGNLITEAKNFSDFTTVDVESGFEVEIIQSALYSVNITTDDNLTDYVQVSKTSNTLKIRLKSGYSYQSVTLRARITMPELYQLKLSSGTRGTVEEFDSSHKLDLDLSGGSSLSIVNMSVGDVEIGLSKGSSLNGDLTAIGDARFSLSEGSSMELNGATIDMLISAFHGSQLELSDFTLQGNADISLSGGSRATVNLDGILDANLSGGSLLLYIGNPTQRNIQVSGGSTIKEK